MMSDTFKTQNTGKQWIAKLWLIGCLLVILCSLVVTPVAGDSLQPGDFEITNPAQGDTVEADSSLRIRWSASAASDGYKIALRDLTTDQKLLDNEDIGTTRSYTVRNLEPSHYYRIAVCAYGGGLTDRWKECEFFVAEEKTNPEIRSLDVTPSEGRAGLDYFTFTIKTNEYVEKVSIEIDGYPVGTTSQFRGSNTRAFTISDVIMSFPGINRNVVAYAYGSNGAVITKFTTINVIATEPAGVPIIISPSDGNTLVLGDSLSVTWSAPSTNPTSYNVYLYYNDRTVFSEMDHSGTSITIPAHKIQSVGTYSIEVYANKRGYSTDVPGQLFISVIKTQETQPTSTWKEPVNQVPVTTIPTTQKPITQVPVTTIPTTQKPVTQVPVTTIPTTQKPVTQVPVTAVPTTQTYSPDDYPASRDTFNSQLGSAALPKLKINKIKIEQDNGFLWSGFGCMGDYTVIIETNTNTEQVIFDIPDHNLYGIILDTYDEKWWFGSYRAFTWKPTSINDKWLHKGKTYTINAYAYNGNSKIPETEKSIKIKGTQPDNVGSLLP